MAGSAPTPIDTRPSQRAVAEETPEIEERAAFDVGYGVGRRQRFRAQNPKMLRNQGAVSGGGRTGHPPKVEPPGDSHRAARLIVQPLV
jgi:hypothetical protein